MLCALHYDCIQERLSDLKLKAMPSKWKNVGKKSDGKFQKSAPVEVKGDGKDYE